MACTKNLIKDTFISIYIIKPIDKITITELSKKANITRGTFYLYYTNIYEVLEEIENEYLEIICKSLNINDIKYNFDSKMILQKNYIENLFIVIEANKLYFKALLTTPNYSLFKYKLENAIHQNFKFILKSKSHLDSFDFLIEYISSAHISCITLWLKQDCETPPYKIYDIMSKILNSILLNL